MKSKLKPMHLYIIAVCVFLFSYHLVDKMGGKERIDFVLENSVRPSMQSTDFTGSILFEENSSWQVFDAGTIRLYDFEKDTALRLATGTGPDANARGEMVFLKVCIDDTLQYFQVAKIETSGLIKNITPCSVDVSNRGLEKLKELGSMGLGSSDWSTFEDVSLSPDGSRLAVEVELNVYGDTELSSQDGSDVYVYDMSGKLVKRLENAYEPDWLPDGRLFYGWNTDFYITDTNLDNPIKVPGSEQFEQAANWAAVHPNGQSIAFVYNKQVWTMNLDGSGLKRQMYSDDGVMEYVTWSPDGKKLASLLYADLADPAIHIKDLVQNTVTRISVEHLMGSLKAPTGKLSWIK